MYSDLKSVIDFNDKGEIALYDKGNLIGYAAIAFVDGVRVLAKKKDYYLKIKQAALIDGVNLTMAAGVRTWTEQYNIRRSNVVDKTKANDFDFIAFAPHFADKEMKKPNFIPMTAKPGLSNHQDGGAIDWNVTKRNELGLKIGMLPSYNWLVKNGLKFGLIRTVPSEEWHWEDLYLKNMFVYVLKDHVSWHGLV